MSATITQRQTFFVIVEDKLWTQAALQNEIQALHRIVMTVNDLLLCL